MQVFARGVDEGLVIGDIVVTVLEIQSDRVRLGVHSPDSVPPYWEETLYLESAEESLQSEAMLLS